MLRSYYRLVMKDGSSLTVGDDWPEADLDVRRAIAWLRGNNFGEAGAALARAAGGESTRINGKIWLIVHQPEIVENYSEGESSFTEQVQTERYLAVMKDAVPHEDGRPHGKKNPASCAQCQGQGCSACPEETQILEISPADVRYAHRLHGFNDATSIVRALFNDMNADLLPPPPDEEDDEDDADEEEEPESERPNGKEITTPAT